MLFFILLRFIMTAGTRIDVEGVAIVNVSGTHYEMGMQYGNLLQKELNATLNILLDYFISEHHMTYEQLLQQSQLFDNRYSYSWDFFLQGIAEGSGLSFNDCKIINSMETIQIHSKINYHYDHSLPQCTFVSLPPSICEHNTTLIGRNYDYGHPFDQIAKYLTVAVIHENEKVPTAIIGLPGQIYCPSCTNKYGIFMELNNGGPSGGFTVDTQRQTLLIKMLETLQNSDNMNDVLMQMNSFQSDYSLIININDAESNGQSYEYSSTLGMKPYKFLNIQSFASTNYYLNDTWDIPPPNDITTWRGVTRRNNILKLTSTSTDYSINDLLEIMEIKIEDGGALDSSTIYQMVFEPLNASLFVRNRYNENWTNIQLKEFW